ncbi:kinase-like protein [Clavulina sp. PMI_390]|nr:kinase-like protein [Clavulina sp. PMI_390]
MVLPFLEPGSLRDALDERPLAPREFQRIVIGISKGVSYLHSHQPPIVHGDLHPGNVLLDESGSPFLCDFGLSRIRHEVTRTHTMLSEGGRLRFLAPELSAGRSESFRTSPQSDIFALSMTFLNAWTGKRPFFEIDNELKAASMMKKGQRPTRVFDQELAWPGPAFLDLLQNMWRQEPSARPPILDVLLNIERLFEPDHNDTEAPPAELPGDP